MRRLFNILLYGFLAICITVSVGSGLVYFLLSASVPDYDEDFTVAGLGGPVDILRDLRQSRTSPRLPLQMCAVTGVAHCCRSYSMAVFAWAQNTRSLSRKGFWLASSRLLCRPRGRPRRDEWAAPAIGAQSVFGTPGRASSSATGRTHSHCGFSALACPSSRIEKGMAPTPCRDWACAHPAILGASCICHLLVDWCAFRLADPDDLRPYTTYCGDGSASTSVYGAGWALVLCYAVRSA